MTKQRFLNNFTSTFIAAVKDAPSSGTPETELDYGVLRISDGAAGSLINPTDGDYYLLTAFKRLGSVESNIEVMRVTGVNNATPGECRITVQRAQEGTTAKAYVSGDYLSLRFTKGSAENMVQKVAGKGLSTEDYTTAEKSKLAGVAAGAQVNTVTSVAGKTGDVTLAKADVGLSDVDNTSDANKPLSTATQNALNSKEGTIASGTTAQYWRGDKTWRDFFTDVRAATLTGLSTATNAVVAATDTVLAAIGKLQAQVSSKLDKTGGDVNGNINFTGTARRITGDFSNATVANRVMFQTSTVNSGSVVGVIPNGSASSGHLRAYGSSDPTNASFVAISCAGASGARIESSYEGAGAYVPMTFHTGGAERLRIDPTTGNVLATSGALGYGVGAGGIVTQATSKSTAVTLNRPTGQITMNNAALGGGAFVAFNFNNSLLSAADGVLLSASTNSNYRVEVAAVSSGVVQIRVTNISTGSLSEALVINFAIIKGATS